MNTRRSSRFGKLLALVALIAAVGAAQAETVLNPNQLSTTLLRRMRSVQNLIRQGQFNDALTQLGYLQGAASSNYEAMVVRELASDYYIARGDYPTALTNLQPVIQSNLLAGAELRQAQSTLAKLYVATGQSQAGLNALRSVLSQGNPSPDVAVTAAQAYAQLGQCSQAIPYLQGAVETATDVPEDWYRLWVACLYNVHDYDGAAQALQELLSRYPGDTQYWAQLGQAYAQTGDASKALAVYVLMYRQGLIRQPQDYMTLTTLYMRNNEPYQAAQILQEGLQSGVVPASEANYTLLASIWQEADETDRVLAALGEAVKASHSGDAYLALAQIYAAHHEWFSVLDNAKKALAAGSLRHPGRAWLLQGIAQSNNRQFDDAATALREALKFDDTRAQADAWLRYLNAHGAAF